MEQLFKKHKCQGGVWSTTKVYGPKALVHPMDPFGSPDFSEAVHQALVHESTTLFIHWLVVHPCGEHIKG